MGTDPEILVPLTSARTGFEAETIAQALTAHGVPAQVFGLSAQVMQWELGYHDAIKVMVRRGDLETASDILKAIKAESVDIDWSEIDVGDRPPDGMDDSGHCLKCGYDAGSIPNVHRCPECGTIVRAAPGTPGADPTVTRTMRQRFPLKLLAWGLVAAAGFVALAKALYWVLGQPP